MWQEILGYFETLEKRPVERMAFLVGGLLIFWIIEGAIPLIQPKYKRNKFRHALVNFGFTIIHLVIHTFLAIIIVILSDWCKKESFGLVYWINAGALGTILVSLFVLDFFVIETILRECALHTGQGMLFKYCCSASSNSSQALSICV